MTDESAFFRFGTNLNSVVTDIEGGLGRINSALKKPLDAPQLQMNTAEFGKGVSRLESEMLAGRAKVQDAFRKFSSGLITQGELQQEVRSSILGSVGQIPTIMAREVGNLPRSVAESLPARQMAQQFARDYVRELSLFARSEAKGAGIDPTGLFTMKPFKDIIGSTTPAYGRENDLRASLQNRQIAEDIIRKDLALDPTGLVRRPEGKAIEKSLGLTQLLDQVRRDHVREIEDPEGNVSYSMDATDTAQRLRDLNAARNEGRAAADNHARSVRSEMAALQTEAIAANKLFDQLKLLQSGVTRVPGGLVDPKGNPLSSSGGALNPLAAQSVRENFDRMKEEEANAARLLQSYEQIQRVGGYSVLGRGAGAEVYKVNTDGSAAKRVTDELKIREILEAQEAALLRVAAAEERAAGVASGRATKEQLNNSGVLGGFLGRFHRGDTDFATGLGGQIASAAAFSFAYGSLFALQHALRDTMHEFLDYQDSVTDLEVATRSADVVTNQWQYSLSQLSKFSGANMGAAYDTAARGIRAFTEDGDSAERIRDVGTATEEAATKIALIANKSLQDATGDVISIGSGYNLGPGQFPQIVDAIANAKRNLGGDPTQIAQGLSLIAGAAQSAGFSLNEAANMISLVQSRTDESGQAISTRLARIFQIVQGSTGKGLAAELGLNANQSAKDLLLGQKDSFASLYNNPDTTDAVKDRITSAIGGTANLKELLPLFKEQNTLLQANRDAWKDAGQGELEFQRKSENLVGLIKQISGDISNIQVQASKSGLFDGVGAAIKTLEPALHTLDKLVATYNQLTDHEIPGLGVNLQSVLGILVDIAVLAKAISLVSGKNSLFGGPRAAENAAIVAATEQRIAAETTMNAAIVGSAERRVAAETGAAVAGTGAEVAGGAAATAARRGGILGGLGTLGRFAANPWTIGIAAVVAGAAAYGKHDEDLQKVRSGGDLFAGGMDQYDINGTASELKDAATAWNTIGGTLSEFKPGWSNAKGELETYQDMSKERARALVELSRVVRQEEAHAASLHKISVFGSGAIATLDQIADGIAALDAKGVSGLGQARAVRKALFTPPPEEGFKFLPGRTAGQLYTSIADSLTGAIKEGGGWAALPGYDPNSTAMKLAKQSMRENGQPITPESLARVSDYTTSDPERIASLLSMGPEMEQALIANLARAEKKMGINKNSVLSPHMQEELVRAAVRALDFDGFVANGGKVKQAIIKSVLASFQDKNSAGPSEYSIFNGPTLTAAQALQLVRDGQPDESGEAKPGLNTIFQQALSDVPADDDGTAMSRELRAQMRTYQMVARKIRAGGDKVPMEISHLVRNATHAYKQAVFDRMDALRQAAEENAKTTAELRGIRNRWAIDEYKAVKGDPALVKALMQQLDTATLAVVRRYAQQARDTAAAAAAAAQSLTTTAAGIIQETINGLPTLHGSGISVNVPDQAAIDKANHASQQAQSDLDALINNAGFAAGAAPSIGGGSDGKTAADKAREHADLIAAMADAHAAAVGGQIAAAKAAITGAKAQMGAEKKGTTEWYQALASFHQAQWQLKEAIEEYHANLYLLRGDVTDPVDQAAAALRTSRDKLRNARAKDEKAAARVEVEQSEAALEKARWDQKLSDMQTAEQLGRISYATYIRYLEHESRRMHDMHNKTRQQIDHMNEIDQALQEANRAAAGMFNLGDIDTRGLVYQVRRLAAVNQQANFSGGGHVPTAITHNNQQININGTDIHMVRQVLREMLGSQAPRVTTSHRRGRG